MAGQLRWGFPSGAGAIRTPVSFTDRWPGLADTAGTLFLQHVHRIDNERLRIVFVKVALNAVATRRRTRFWVTHPHHNCCFCSTASDAVSHWPACPVLLEVSASLGATWSPAVLFLQVLPDSVSLLFVAAVYRVAVDCARGSYGFPTSVADRRELMSSWVDFYRQPSRTAPRPPRRPAPPSVLSDHHPHVWYRGHYQRVHGWDDAAPDGGLACLSHDSADVYWVSLRALHVSDRSRRVHAFCDGSCTAAGAGLGVTIVGLTFRPIDIACCLTVERFPFLDGVPLTNNVAEYCAALVCFRFLRARAADLRCPVHVFLDSKLVQSSLNNRSRGVRLYSIRWRVQEALRALRALVAVHLFHVFAHSGVYFNDRADQLAARGATGAYTLYVPPQNYSLATCLDASPFILHDPDHSDGDLF